MAYNIIYCLDTYWGKSGIGASNALRSLINNNNKLESYKLYCKNYVEGEFKDIIPIKASGKDVVNEFLRGAYKCIHWIRADSCELYLEIINELKERHIKIPIISTICQQPDSPGLFLGPMEVKYPSHIVFIDNTAYNNKFFRFIPKSRKSMIRFGGSTKETYENADRILNSTKKEDSETIVFGRGSTLNKCPRNMFDIFDRIVCPKKFVIVGDGPKEWMQEEIAKRDYEVVLLDSMPYNQWLRTVASFDVFIYHLPMDAYSSTDGTMVSAMLMKKPVVYYGPEGPKEALEHNVNALIAQSEDELVEFCNELAKNEQKRIQLGENARGSHEHAQTREQFYDKINRLYEHARPIQPIKLTMNYFYNYICYKKKNDKKWPIHDHQLSLCVFIDNLRVRIAFRTRLKVVKRKVFFQYK